MILTAFKIMMSFDGDFFVLVDEGYLSSMPLDPINSTSNTTSSNVSNGYFYTYRCWGNGWGVDLRYREEATGGQVRYAFENPIGEPAGSRADNFFDCGNS